MTWRVAWSMTTTLMLGHQGAEDVFAGGLRASAMLTSGLTKERVGPGRLTRTCAMPMASCWGMTARDVFAILDAELDIVPVCRMGSERPGAPNSTSPCTPRNFEALTRQLDDRAKRVVDELHFDRD